MRSARALLVAGTAVAAAVLALPPGPAAAHTTLRESDPAANGSVEILPQVVRLTFTTQLPSTPTIEVVDANGASVNSSPVSLRGNTALQPVQGSGAGRYTVNWKATAPDGHQITGSFAFTVAAGNVSPSPAASPTVPATTGPSPTEAAAPPAQQSGPRWPWLAAGLLAVALLTLFWYLRRRRLSAAGR
jgi:methionine-rich copper-binding protein CopC